MFIAALFIIARTWKQPRCPSADEWIRKLWYIYSMEYYSAIKKNSFESVLMRWMKLEPIIQSEVSQKDKDLSFSYPQSFPASGTFPVSQLFSSDDQNGWSFSFSISPSNEYSGLISLKIDWFDILDVQGALGSFLQQHSSKASILCHSALFIVWLLQRYVTTGIIKLWTSISPSYLFISKVLWDLWYEFPLSWFEIIIFPPYHAT